MSAILLQYLGMLKTFQVCNALCNLQGKGYTRNTSTVSYSITVALLYLVPYSTPTLKDLKIKIR